MPAFRLLPQSDLEAVVDYVLALTHRGELEARLRGRLGGRLALATLLAADPRECLSQIGVDTRRV